MRGRDCRLHFPLNVDRRLGGRGWRSASPADEVVEPGSNVFVGGVDDPYDRDRGTKRDCYGEPVAAAPSFSRSLTTPSGSRSWRLTFATAPLVFGSLTAGAGRRSWRLTCAARPLVFGSLTAATGSRSSSPALGLAGLLFLEKTLDSIPIDGLRGRHRVAGALGVRIALPFGRFLLVCARLGFSRLLSGLSLYWSFGPAEAKATRAPYPFPARRLAPKAYDFSRPVTRPASHPLVSGPWNSRWSPLA